MTKPTKAVVLLKGGSICPTPTPQPRLMLFLEVLILLGLGFLILQNIKEEKGSNARFGSLGEGAVL